MKKLVKMLLDWYKRGAKMEICEAGIPQPAAVLPEETVVQPDETSFENAKPIPSKNAKPASSKDKKPENMLDDLQQFLAGKYDFRYNLLSEQTEYREQEMAEDSAYLPVSQRDLNTFCLEARASGISCWDKDVSRLLNSRKVENYHPFLHYMNHLP